MLVQDFYDVLGVDRGADKKAIKTAYRQKARQYHPDVNKEAGAEDKFKRISNAYEVLSDDSKRGIYDRCARCWDIFIWSGWPAWHGCHCGLLCCASVLSDSSKEGNHNLRLELAGGVMLLLCM